MTTEQDSSERDTLAHDLPGIARKALGEKPAWSHQSDDLSINLISCTAGQGISSHVNSEVDVLVIGIDGEGAVEVDGRWQALGPGQAVVIPKGAQRATRCDGDVFAYLTCHRRRSGLWPVVRGKEDTTPPGRHGGQS